MSKNAVTQAIVKLFESERFYAEIISQMSRILSDRVPLAGVRIKDRPELFINPTTFAELPLEERVAVLKHECEHILRDHIARFKELAPEIGEKPKAIEDDIINSMKHKIMNVSADCAINGTMKDLPQWGCFPKNFDLKNGETMEWYLEQLKNNKKAKELMEYDDHAIWAESEGDKELLKEKIRQMINKAAKNTRNAGQMTAQHESIVSAWNKPSVNWREQLKRFVARSTQVLIDTTKKRRNRRYGVQFPGIIKTEELHIGVAIDTSGSVSDAALTQFMAEIGNIAKYAKVTVVEADTEVKTSYIYKPKKEYKISGRGGTAYQPAFDFFNEEEVDAVIYFGDMDAFDQENIKKPRYPVLWAIVGEQDPPADFGSQVRITM